MKIVNEPHRCFWCNDSQIYRDYHDTEWGFPVFDDTQLFEKICLEGFQSGLSWLTILRKRENFRRAFNGFDIASLVRFTQKDIALLMADTGIVRHRGKIEAAINNARCAEKLLESETSLAAYFWRFEPETAIRPQAFDVATLKQLTQTKESIALSQDLKQRGWQFVGPTSMYAFMQAMGLVNDHDQGCHVREAALEARRQVKVPT
jgi:DNA-3-methyladenine glycosylase I